MEQTSLQSFLQTPWAGALLFAVAMLVAIPGVLSFVRGARAQDRVTQRLERKKRTGNTAQTANESRIGKAMVGFGNSAAPGDEEEVSVVRAKLIQAGYYSASAVGRYYFARFMCVVLPQLALLFALPRIREIDMLPGIAPVVISIFLVLLGLSAPSIYIDKKISGRRQDCSAGFPDMMDLLVACVEAGLSLDAAVQRVAEELEQRHPIIARHMHTLSLELRAGRERKIAWRNFSDKLGIEEAGSLATMLRQAEEMGTSLGQTLRVFSADMRKRRILMAEEKAMALPAKLTVPLVVFVFPVLLGVLIMPAIVNLQTVMG